METTVATAICEASLLSSSHCAGVIFKQIAHKIHILMQSKSDISICAHNPGRLTRDDFSLEEREVATVLIFCSNLSGELITFLREIGIGSDPRQSRQGPHFDFWRMQYPHYKNSVRN